MSKNTKVVIGIVVLALLCSSIPVMTPLLFGIGNQSGAIPRQSTSQLLNSVLFIGVTKLSSGNLLTSIIGLAFSIYFRPINPKKFRLTTIAFGLVLISTIVQGLLSGWVEVNLLQAGAPQAQTAMGYSITACISSLLHIASWVLLFVVLFGQKFNQSANNS